MEQAVINTIKWIENVVIGCNFCPFAAREMTRKSVHFELATAADRESVLTQLHQLMERMDNERTLETALLILPEGWDDFLGYLDIVELAEELIEETDYEGIYQVASFHPHYQFEGTSVDDPANYTNRSPYPMLHLLREESVEKALQSYPGDPELIPERNMEFARNKGLTYMKSLFIHV